MSAHNLNLTLFSIAKSTLLALSLIFIPAIPAIAGEPASAADIPARLVIASIGLDSEIVPVGWQPVRVNGQTYGQWLAADNQVGWHNLSARLGRPGNTVLSGHSDVYARIFRDLWQVDIGDEITIFTAAAAQPHRYRITQKFLVREKGVSLETRIKNAQLIAPTPDERLTLITCARPGATHRLIVIARPELTGERPATKGE